MGTNFYWHEKPACASCGHLPDGLHIGKSSPGWCFALRVHPDRGIHLLSDWMPLFHLAGSHILDEYDEAVAVEKMLETITARVWDGKPIPGAWGPGGLVRHSVGDRLCVGLGTGTWDYIDGEFS